MEDQNVITPLDCQYCGKPLYDAFVMFCFITHTNGIYYNLIHRYHIGCWAQVEDAIRAEIDERNALDDGLEDAEIEN